jgi:hypothetical protein
VTSYKTFYVYFRRELPGSERFFPGEAEGDTPMSDERTETNKKEVEVRRVQIVRGQDIQPPIPKIPAMSTEYEGFFAERRKRRELRRITETATERAAFLRQENAVHSEVLKLAWTRTDIVLVGEHAVVQSLELQVKEAQLNDQLHLQRKRRAVEQMKLDVELAKCEAELHKLKQPPPPPQPPSQKSIDEIAKETAQRKIQRARLQLETIAAIQRAESELLQKYPEEHHKAIKSYVRETIEVEKEEM